MYKRQKEGEPAVFTMEVETDGIKEAVHAAENAQRAVLVLGCNPVINSKEEIDRSTPVSYTHLSDTGYYYSLFYGVFYIPCSYLKKGHASGQQ